MEPENSLIVMRLTPQSPLSDQQAYADFVESSPQGILYCHSWWLETLAPGCCEVLLVRKGNEIKAAWPMIFSRTNDGICAGMPPLTQKLGILFGPTRTKYVNQLTEEHRLTKMLIQELPESYGLDQGFHENFQSWLPFFWQGFYQITRYTYVLADLTDMQLVWDNLRKDRRKEIQQARRNQITIHETNDLELFYHINKLSFERQGLPIPYSLDLISRLDACLQRHAGRRITLAKDPQGRIHAGDYLAYDRRCAISLMGGADTDLRRSHAKLLLEWESIDFASTVSQRFDFEGSMMPNVETVVRGFGGRLTPYFRLRRMPRQPRINELKSPRRLAAKMLRKIANMIDS
jgi:hypothetical protein